MLINYLMKMIIKVKKIYPLNFPKEIFYIQKENISIKKQYIKKRKTIKKIITLKIKIKLISILKRVKM